MLCPPPHGCARDLLTQKLIAREFCWPAPSPAPAEFEQRFLIPTRQRIGGSASRSVGLNILTPWDLRGGAAALVWRNHGRVCARGRSLQPMRQGYEVIIPDLLTVLCTFANGMEGVLGVQRRSMRMRSPIASKSTAISGTVVHDFGSDVVQASRIGDPCVAYGRAHARPGNELACGRRFHRRGALARADPAASKFRGWRALHASGAGGGRLARSQRVGRNQEHRALTNRTLVGRSQAGTRKEELVFLSSYNSDRLAQWNGASATKMPSLVRQDFIRSRVGNNLQSLLVFVAQRPRVPRDSFWLSTAMSRGG
mgnify:CR=1 FL=1